MVALAPLTASLLAAAPTPVTFDGVPADVRAVVEDQLHALPPQLQSFPGGPLRFTYRAEPGPLGMAEREEDGSFALYPFAPTTDRRANIRTARMTSAQVEELWRRRALVHAVISRFDAALRWSDRSEWRRITGWTRPLDRPTVLFTAPLNPYAFAYSRALGATSPAMDLATFAEELLVPVERFGADLLPIDDRVRCQEFSKTRFLAARIAALDGRRAEDLFPPMRCPAFEQEARPADFVGAEVLFAEASAAHPESLFGHVLLRLRYAGGRDGAAVAPSYDPVIQIAAVQGDDPPLQYAWAGLTGGLTTVFSRASLGSVLKTNVEQDQRTIQRYALRLSADERSRLLERTWELERRAFPPYAFANRNCAAWLLYVLNSAVDTPRVTAEPALGVVVTPTATLDALARTTSFDGGALIQKIPEPFFSHRALAERAVANAHSAGDDWDVWLQSAVHAQPAARIALFQSPPDLAPDRSAVAQKLAEALAVEQWRADRATVALARLEAARTVTRGSVVTSAELVARRQATLEHEDRPARETASMADAERAAETRDQSALRPMTAGEQARFAEASTELRAYDALLQTAGRLIREGVPVSARAEELQSSAIAAEREHTAISRPVSGLGTLGLGAGFIARAGSATATAEISAALARERLGDQRAIGFSARTELRLLDATAELAFANGVSLSALDLTVVRLTNAERHLPGDGALLGPLGWTAGMALHHDALATHRSELYALAQVHASDESMSNFVALGLGPAAVLSRASFQPSGRIELTARGQLGPAAATHASLSAEPGYDLTSHRPVALVRAEADVELGRGTVVPTPWLAFELTHDGRWLARGGLRVTFE